MTYKEMDDVNLAMSKDWHERKILTFKQDISSLEWCITNLKANANTLQAELKELDRVIAYRVSDKKEQRIAEKVVALTSK